MKTVIHVNQHKIRSNIKRDDPEPVLTVKDYKQNRYAHEVVIKTNGDEVARIVYRPHKPLSCGARCWIETTQDVELIDG
jgi:hypothetical protein